MSHSNARDPFAEVTAKIVNALEQGTVPWHRPWGFTEPAQNHFSGHQYRGVNALLMLLNDYQTPYFATMRQINEAGGRVKKGTKATAVYFRDVNHKDATGKRIAPAEYSQRKQNGDTSLRAYSFMKIFPVFNMQNVEGCPVKPNSKTANPDNQTDQLCETFLSAIQPAPQIKTVATDQPGYSPTTDAIYMPPINQFDESAHYYAVLFHELTHWTGHATRLNRPAVVTRHDFGTETYSREELTAELGAAFLCLKNNVLTDRVLTTAENYIGGWLKALINNKMMIWEAATEAQAAVQFLTSQNQ